MPDGRTINEKITVTESEEDITVLGEDTRIIYDYNKVYVCLSKVLPVKILIRLRAGTGCSESSLGANVRRYSFLSCAYLIL